ncbi:helix-turn-helix domain-containing protein [Comamonas sp.]|uniref:helix-turn-helix domain-containing protein n=1 Tax=Comamonas sp. TaxID=34028 RepID=UPI003A93F4AC
MSIKLDEAIRERLAAQKGDWSGIALRAGVSHSWMSKFANGHIHNPGIRTLEKLDAALDGARSIGFEPQQESAVAVGEHAN